MNRSPVSLRDILGAPDSWSGGCCGYIPMNSARVESNHDQTIPGYCEPASHRDRQLLDYNQCTAEELIQFALERKLIQKAPREKKMRLLVDLLEAADRQRKFRFVDLPPELRCQVYDHYLRFFPRLAPKPRQPSLSKTCKLVRTELLPLFYESFQCQFKMQRTEGTDFEFDFDTRQFLDTIQPHLLDKIRHIRLIVTHNSGLIDDTTYEFDVVLKRGENQIGSGVTLKRTVSGFPPLDLFIDHPLPQIILRSALDQATEKIKQYLLEFVEKRACDGKLTKEDVCRMLGEIQEAAFSTAGG